MTASTTSTAAAQRRAAWVVLLALCLGFSLSQAFRTLAAMMAPPLRADLGLSSAQLGVFAATFHFAFGAMQIFMGIGLDLHGVRRTVLLAFPLAIAGALLSALAPGFAAVVVGQALIGIGCAPAFLACTVFIARSFPVAQFAAISGLVMGIGGIGMLLTGTPLAWLVDQTSWRAGFLALGVASALAWLGMYLLVRPDAPAATDARESVPEAMRRFGALLLEPPTWGIVLLSAITYASFITLRGLWLGPMLTEQWGLSLVQSGHVALAVSLVSLITPSLFGRLRVRGLQRRRWIAGFTLALAALFGALALASSATVTITVAVAIGVLCGFIVLQYADVRASYPENLTGRALSVFTMAMFLGIALMQWLTGLVASVAATHQWDPFSTVHAFVALLLVVGAVGFIVLPSNVADR